MHCLTDLYFHGWGQKLVVFINQWWILDYKSCNTLLSRHCIPQCFSHYYLWIENPNLFMAILKRQFAWNLCVV